MKHIVIVDIDGTISVVGERGKFLLQTPPDYEAFYADPFEDEPIPEMVDLVQSLFEEGYHIVFCTSRREESRPKTRAWMLRHFSGPFCAQYRMLMRPEGNLMNDADLKTELLRQIDLNEVAFAIEDTPAVVRRLRAMGILCLQVMPSAQEDNGEDEISPVRKNLLNETGYTPYCGNNLPRTVPGGCNNPRTFWSSDKGQFICHGCGWESKFPKEFIERYKLKWNLQQ